MVAGHVKSVVSLALTHDTRARLEVNVTQVAVLAMAIFQVRRRPPTSYTAVQATLGRVLKLLRHLLLLGCASHARDACIVRLTGVMRGPSVGVRHVHLISAHLGLWNHGGSLPALLGVAQLIHVGLHGGGVQAIEVVRVPFEGTRIGNRHVYFIFIVQELLLSASLVILIVAVASAPLRHQLLLTLLAVGDGVGYIDLLSGRILYVIDICAGSELLDGADSAELHARSHVSSVVLAADRGVFWEVQRRILSRHHALVRLCLR